MIKKLYRKIFSEKLRLRQHIAKRRFQSFFLRGNTVYCPCCNHSFSKFLRKGNGIDFRENAVCPNCGSLERTRLFYLYLKNETSIFRDHAFVLHLAPEEILKEKLISNPNYIDGDLNPNYATHQIDITRIPFPDNNFDFIICSHILGHIPDEKKALEELYRVLKVGGNLFFLSLLDFRNDHTLEFPDKNLSAEERLKFFGEKDLERLYGTDFEKRISRSNIEIEKIDYRSKFTAAEREKMSLGDGMREIIYKVSKLRE